MRVVLQRVIEASVTINQVKTASIAKGMLALVGFENNDSQEDIEWTCQKMLNLRIFNDEKDIMNLSLLEKRYELLVVSQFTLHALTKKGNRPSYMQAARPETAIPLYEKTIAYLTTLLSSPVKTGTFGADMKVQLINDGPVTIWLDSKNKG